ncbi:MAG: ATP-binding cassette domain-containing protein [Candidatus Cloacimonadaceae bacterium]|jgi:ABC-type iron transport system FetAB ATPase subunit|nr:ATP-binding cassette domain-containing protein [Candidatus Cloacimonadota bacterium]MDX9949447.1 ATP-binding cassette domain-containing protein [Candidatus Syntrophosphaera sp.]
MKHTDENLPEPEQDLLHIRIKKLFYEDLELVSNIDLKVSQGEKILLTGSTGSGKSSLLNTLNLMNQSYEGEVLFLGKPVTEYTPEILRSQIVMVMQEPWLGDGSVSEVLDEALSFCANRKRQSQAQKHLIVELFKTFQLPEDYLLKKAEQLSGGEKQRVALIRAMMLQPQILLLDEVSSALDQTTSGIISDFIFGVCGSTVIAISHDPLWQSRWQRRWRIQDGRIHDNGGN